MSLFRGSCEVPPPPPPPPSSPGSPEDYRWRWSCAAALTVFSGTSAGTFSATRGIFQPTWGSSRDERADQEPPLWLFFSSSPENKYINQPSNLFISFHAVPNHIVCPPVWFACAPGVLVRAALLLSASRGETSRSGMTAIKGK